MKICTHASTAPAVVPAKSECKGFSFLDMIAVKSKALKPLAALRAAPGHDSVRVRLRLGANRESNSSETLVCKSHIQTNKACVCIFTRATAG